MLNKKKVFVGLLILIFAIILFAVLHDFTNLYIFKDFQSSPIFEKYKEIQILALSFLKKVPCFKFINNHLVDFLWFLSFALIITEFLPEYRKIRFLGILLMALLSEFSQLLCPRLGTFDIFDLIGYFLIACVLVWGKVVR